MAVRLHALCHLRWHVRHGAITTTRTRYQTSLHSEDGSKVFTGTKHILTYSNNMNYEPDIDLNSVKTGATLIQSLFFFM